MKKKILTAVAGTALTISSLGFAGAAHAAPLTPTEAVTSVTVTAANDNSRAFNKWVCKTLGWFCPKCYDNWCS